VPIGRLISPHLRIVLCACHSAAIRLPMALMTLMTKRQIS